MNSLYTAANTINKLHGNCLDLSTLMDELINSSERISDNNIKEIEQMLITQAKTLDYVFYHALNHLTDLSMINQIDVFTNIAFKAQSQSRKTLAILAKLKNPRRTTFINQQNNALTQQVNNGVKSNSENSKKVANELLSGANHASLDLRGASETICTDQTMATMEKVNRGKDNRGTIK